MQWHFTSSDKRHTHSTLILGSDANQPCLGTLISTVPQSMYRVNVLTTIFHSGLLHCILMQIIEKMQKKTWFCAGKFWKWLKSNLSKLSPISVKRTSANEGKSHKFVAGTLWAPTRRVITLDDRNR